MVSFFSQDHFFSGALGCIHRYDGNFILLLSFRPNKIKRGSQLCQIWCHQLNYLHKETVIQRCAGESEENFKVSTNSLLNLFSHRKIAGVATLGSLKAKVLKGNVLRNDSVIKARTTISYWTEQFTKIYENV